MRTAYFFESLQLVETIQGGDLVGFRERWIVENGIAEVLQGSSQRQHRLADVDDFRGAVSDHVDAQKLQEYQGRIKSSAAPVIAEHLPFRQLRVTRQSYFVGDLFLGQLFFRASYHRDFRNCVDPVRNQIRRHFSGFAEHVATGQAALFHGGTGQGGKSDYITRSINMWNGGLEMFVGHEFAASIGR